MMPIIHRPSRVGNRRELRSSARSNSSHRAESQCELGGLLPGLFANFTYDDVRDPVLDPVAAETGNSPIRFGQIAVGHHDVVMVTDRSTQLSIPDDLLRRG
jgi:hypothetical protein